MEDVLALKTKNVAGNIRKLENTEIILKIIWQRN